MEEIELGTVSGVARNEEPVESLQRSQCAFCAHKHEGGAKCDAFPAGIPFSILMNSFDHSKPWEGDLGIQYKAKEGAPNTLKFTEIGR